MNPRDLMLLETRHTNDERNFAMSQSSFMINMDVRVVPPGTLPVFELKAKRFRDFRNSEIPSEVREQYKLKRVFT
jgi:hypothetical protein